MIVYFLGIPGSGKTYYGVNVIYDNFAKNIPKKTKLTLKKDYENCYTNINEFNFDLTNNVYKLDFDELYDKLQILYDMYKKKMTDDNLIEKSKELKIYKSLFIIDECHNFFDTADKVKIWWLTYHRHLYHDIYLITQNLSLVNAKYKPLAEAFYRAKSSSLTLNKRFFNYMYYTESRMTKASFVNTLKVSKRQEVFKLYKSGDKVESKNVILRFIYISIFAFFVLIVLGYFFYHKEFSTPAVSNKHQITKISSSVPVNVSQNSNNVEDNQDVSDLIYMNVTCTTSMCSYKNYYFDVKLLTFAKKHFNLKVINSIRMFKSEKISLAVNSAFLQFIQGGSNDKFSQDSSSISDSINPFKSK